MEWMLLPLKRYADFGGRSRRMEYWMFLVFQILIWVAFNILSVVLIGGSLGAAMMARANPAAAGVAAGSGMVIMTLLALLIWLGLLIPSLAVAVRRLHDIDRSGWWLLAPLIGYLVLLIGIVARSAALSLVGTLAGLVLGITLLVFAFLDGTVGYNRFGADPKGRADAAVFA